jgi:hypothetical protein
MFSANAFPRSNVWCPIRGEEPNLHITAEVCPNRTKRRPLDHCEGLNRSRKRRLNHHLRGQGTASHRFSVTLMRIHRGILEDFRLALRHIVVSINTGTVDMNWRLLARSGGDRLNAGLPFTEIILGILKDLACQGLIVIRLASITRNNRGVIDVVEQATSMASQDGLLLGTLNDGRQVDIIGFLELLPGLQMI